MIHSAQRIAHTLIHVTQITTVCVLVASCSNTGARNESKTSASSPTSKPANMKYKKVEPANALGYAKVTLGDGATYAEGVIDGKGAEVIAPQTTLFVTDITDAVALLQFANKFLFVDLDKGPVDVSLFETTKGFEFAEPFRSGLALVKVNDEQFYINADGERPLKETYDHAETFHNDRALVYQGERKRIIDPMGKTIKELKYDQTNPYTALLWQVTRIKGDLYLSGFVDLNGKEVVPLIYEEIGMYEEDVKRTRVRIKDKLGFLDENALVAIPLIYEYAEIFGKGKARVRLNGRVFFIDPMGKEVAE